MLAVTVSRPLTSPAVSQSVSQSALRRPGLCSALSQGAELSSRAGPLKRQLLALLYSEAGSLTPPMTDSQLDTLSDKLNYQSLQIRLCSVKRSHFIGKTYRHLSLIREGVKVEKKLS